MKRTMLAVLLLAACNGRQATELPYYLDAALTPIWVSGTDVERVHTVSDFTLVDQSGHSFTSDSLDGRVHIASFFFASCGDICPLTHRLLKAAADSFVGDDRVMLVSYSVTPARDSVPVLATFAAHNGIDMRRWRLLTGEPATVERLKKSYLVGTGRGSDYGVDSVAHTEMVVLVDGARRIRGVYNATLRLDVQQLIRDARVLLARGP